MSPEALYQTVLESLRRGRADLVREPLARLRKELPGDENLRVVERQAAVIGFEWPAVRAPLATTRRNPPRAQDIDIVAFHVDIPNAARVVPVEADYIAALALAFESARIRAPAARRILLTDPHTAVPESIGIHDVMRFPLDATLPMYERMRVQALYLRQRAGERASVLMDSDIVVNADPAAVFAEDFDVGLTWREELPDAPFNGGMIFAAPGDGAARFLESARACYDAIARDAAVGAHFPSSLKAWWGDQLALAALVGHRAFAERTAEALCVDGLRVRLFPCSEYNCTLAAGRRYTLAELADKYFIHFKGPRKAMQARYLELMRAGPV